MNSSGTEIEKIIDRIKSIEVTYESFLSRIDIPEDTEATSDNRLSIKDKFIFIRKEIDELKRMLRCDKI
jgi:hypothetical protein